MQRILLVAAVVAAGLTGCANPAPNSKPYTSIPPAPLQPNRPDQMSFPTSPGSSSAIPPPNFSNPRDSSGLTPPTMSNPGAAMPAPKFPDGTSQTSSQSNSAFVPRSQNMASTQIAPPPGSPMAGGSPSDYPRVGQPNYNSSPPNLPTIATANQSLSVPPAPPQYPPMSQAPPMYPGPITASNMPPAMPPAMPAPVVSVPGVNAPQQFGPPTLSQPGMPTTTYQAPMYQPPPTGAPLRGF